MARIGIMGGTFDPIHNGHLMLGRQAYREYGLDAVWYMPSGTPPHKKGQEISPAQDRCAMVALAVNGEEGLSLSEFETRREGTTYTAETLGLLTQEQPKDEFYFIIGADSLYEIENWYHPEKIFVRAKILAAAREYAHLHRTLDGQIAYLGERFGASIQKLHCGMEDISSHEIREAVAAGRDIRRWVPDAVAAYIETHHLYQEKYRE